MYGFIGIPICGLFLASTTNYFSNIFLNLYEKQKKKHKDKRHSIVIAAFVFLLPGLTFFYFIPSAIFMVLEVSLVAQYYIIFLRTGDQHNYGMVTQFLCIKGLGLSG